MAYSISTFLLLTSAIFDLLIAISIPFFSSLNIFIVGINFTNNTGGGTGLFVDQNASVTGFVNSEPVQNLTNIQVRLSLSFFCFASALAAANIRAMINLD
jgi:hypothetical protein